MTQRFGPAYAAGTLTTAASGLLPSAYRTPEGRRAAIHAARRPLAPPVYAALREQNAWRAGTGPGRVALEKLGSPDLSVVVTGQQVGLFGGPLYAFWKAATAIAWAQRLEAEFGTPVVPVFWLQTEDHDIDEVRSATLVDARGVVHRTAVERDSVADRCALAHHALGPDADAAIDRVESILRGLPHQGATIARLRQAYRSGAAWSDAYAALLGDAFADTELVFIQPRCGELGRESLAVHRAALARHEDLSDALTASTNALEAHGFGAQVPVRTDCSLSFFHPDGPAGDRHRLRLVGGRWHLTGGDCGDVHDRVMTALEDDPLAFSTSALLRPIVQDTLLPTAAYVGGPGELSYWAQLPAVYQLFGKPFPLVVPRANGTLLDDGVQARLNRYGVDSSVVSADPDATLQSFAPKVLAEFSGLGEHVEAAVRASLSDVEARAVQVDPELARAFAKTAVNARRAADKLARKVERAALRSDPQRTADAAYLSARMFPSGVPQSRSLCWPDLAARVGPAAVGAVFLDAVRPWVERGETDPLEVML